MSALPVSDAADDPKRGLRVMTSRRVAIILLNLGGPNEPQAVRPFLFNLFNDKAIIGAPQPFRYLLAQLISRSREKAARANYALMGGGSPILPETQKQADALEAEISTRVSNVTFKCFPAMRYWTPLIRDAAKAAESWGATDAVLLPLYPQFSTTTTASSLDAWKAVSRLPSSTICCYPVNTAFAQAHADAVLTAWRNGGSPPNPRVLFSAHGLPQRVIDRGDPYQWQIEQTVAAVRARLPSEWSFVTCYQSRVGPLKWIGPSTESEIRRAAMSKSGLIVAPIAFVSEHIETLVELDVEYAQLARELGAPYYLRAPALGAARGFIDALVELVERAISSPGAIQSGGGGRFCPASLGRCAKGDGS